ncbi:MAG: AraC family transcriptional regulator [Sphingomonadales bacterium]|nr:AraC family transcriptional regulator [Sphingomonadales bacterium]
MTSATTRAQSAAEAAFEQVHAGTLALFPELVRELGGDADALLMAVGIEPGLIARPAPRASLRAIVALLESTATALACPDFGLRLAARQGSGKVFGPIGVVMRNSATFGEALRFVAAHNQAYSMATAIPLEHDRAGARMFVGYDILLSGLASGAQLVEQAVLLAHLNALESTGGRARAREVWFRHQPLSPLRTYREHFACEVRFDQRADGLYFSDADLATPIVDPVSDYRELAALFIDAHFPVRPRPMHARVRGLVRRQIGHGDCRIDHIAEALCIHPRTLHRRLEREGTAFEAIKDEVRRDLARYYLERTRLPVTRIAERLGYAETSVLSRSCLRWFGAPPRDLRGKDVRGA